MGKQARISKAFLYLTAAVLIFVFHEKIIPYAGYLVGGVVLAWSLEELVILLHARRFSEISVPVVQLVIALLLFLTAGDINTVCIIWGVWSVIRESREMTGALTRVIQHRTGWVNIAESLVVIVLSVLMILEPGEHHAHVHIILLGIELILEIVFPLTEAWADRRAAERKAKKN